MNDRSVPKYLFPLLRISIDCMPPFSQYLNTGLTCSIYKASDLVFKTRPYRPAIDWALKQAVSLQSIKPRLLNHREIKCESFSFNIFWKGHFAACFPGCFVKDIRIFINLHWCKPGIPFIDRVAIDVKYFFAFCKFASQFIDITLYILPRLAIICFHEFFEMLLNIRLRRPSCFGKQVSLKRRKFTRSRFCALSKYPGNFIVSEKLHVIP